MCRWRTRNDFRRQSFWHQRSVQSGGDTPTELEKPAGSGAGHPGVGGLVQQSQVTGTTRPHRPG